MRSINRTAQFKRDYKRELKGQHSQKLESDLSAVLKLLVADKPLPEKYRDHPLSGEWKKLKFRDCHVNPDLVLVYRLIGNKELELARIGSHSELFG
jgi:mRNA interferase YafQ